MKYLIMCEGPNELEVINILLEHNFLQISEDDLLGLTPYHARQIDSSPQVRTALNIYPGNDVVVLRIGDTQKDKLRIPPEYRSKITDVQKFCTKPEIEMLLIISGGLISDYEKVKSTKPPKQFAKEKVFCGKRRYDNKSNFYADYYRPHPELLVKAIIEYRHINGSHSKNEKYLADLLK